MDERTDGALNADLMRTAGVPLDSCHLIGWHNAATLARHMRQDEGSYIWRAEHPEEARYREGLQKSATLADLYDLVASFAYMYSSAHKGRLRRPDPYPRPWGKKRQTIGRGAIPVRDFERWYYGGD